MHAKCTPKTQPASQPRQCDVSLHPKIHRPHKDPVNERRQPMMKRGKENTQQRCQREKKRGGERAGDTYTERGESDAEKQK